MKIVLILLLLSCRLAWGGMENTSSTSPSSHDSCLIIESQKERLIGLTRATPFKVTSNRNDGAKYDSWALGHYIFRCNGDTGYDCELLFNKKKLMSDHIFMEYDVNSFGPYIYQSEKKGFPYEVILVEGEQERGSSWYYMIVLKNNTATNSFFIARGRRAMGPPSGYIIVQHPGDDEIYIALKEYISIFIDGDQQIIFRLNEDFLYPENEEDVIGSNTGFTCMERKLRR